MRYLLVLVLCLASTGLASSDSSEVELLSPEAVKAGKDALEKFNLAPMYVNEVANRDELKGELLERCETEPILNCLSHLFRRNHDVRLALPDHPAYWEAWHSLIESSPFGAEPGSTGNFNGPRNDWARVMGSCREWLLRDLALHKPVDVERFLAFYHHVLRLSAGSETLMERMIFGACVGIAHHHMQLLMPIYASIGDRESLIKIRAALRPFTREERSLRRTLLGELRYSRYAIDELDSWVPSDFPDTEHVPLGTLDELRVWAKQRVDQEGVAAANFLGDLSEQTWTDYWGLSAPARSDSEAYHGEYGIRAYVGIVRALEVYVFVNQALADMYLGYASVGLSSQEPPPYFQWVWKEEEQQICLTPTSFAQGKSDLSETTPACATYADPGEVRAVMRE